jgi:sugar/nucleoside kinase (ribokinase family)
MIRCMPASCSATRSGARPSSPMSSSTRASVVCAGVVVADVFVPLLQRLPEPGELVATEDFVVETGGCAANAGVALARLGVQPTVVAKVGDDLFGDFVVRELREAGVDVSGIGRVTGLGTSKTVIVPVNGEDRRYVHTFGANAALRAADIAPAIVTAPDVLYVGGFLVLPALRQDELAAELRRARQSGTRVVLDVVAPSGRPLSPDDVAGVLAHVDYFLPNDDEAAALTGERDPRDQVERLLELGAGTVVVTMGEQGVVAGGPDGLIELPAPRVEVVEPSGAGDAFAAGLVYGLVEGWAFPRCLEFASIVGASACTRLGCTAGLPTRAEADAYLEGHARCP